MASKSISMIRGDGGGEHGDPLTPFEKDILERLLKKQGSSKIDSESSSCSVRKIDSSGSKEKEAESDAALDDDQLAELMREYDGFPDSSGDEADSDPEITFKNRGRGRESKSSRGNRRGIALDSYVDDDDSDPDEPNMNDPFERGWTSLEQMSDRQAMQWVEKYKKESNPGDPIDTDAFLAWLGAKLTPLFPPAPMTRGKKTNRIRGGDTIP